MIALYRLLSAAMIAVGMVVALLLVLAGQKALGLSLFLVLALMLVGGNRA